MIKARIEITVNESCTEAIISGSAKDCVNALMDVLASVLLNVEKDHSPAARKAMCDCISKSIYANLENIHPASDTVAIDLNELLQQMREEK